MSGRTGMSGMSGLRVGACQTPEILGDVEAALACIESFAEQAEARGVDLLLFPECFLQGYLVEEPHLRAHALELDGDGFAAVLKRLKGISQTLVFGVVEQQGDGLFNTAVVVEGGVVLGAYRKTHLIPGEALFHQGKDYPVFDLKGVRFGINICYDAQFAEAAAGVAAQGAGLLLLAAQNMMRRQSADRWKDLHNKIRTERVRETGMWLVSSDVTGERGEERVCYGPTCVINPLGEVVARVPLMRIGMAVAEIPEHEIPSTRSRAPSIGERASPVG